MQRLKRFGALICVLVFCFTLTTAQSAYASGSLVPQSFGAWISAALASINIIGQSLMPAPGPIDPYFKWLSSPVSYTQSYEYPVSQSLIQDYLNASTIVVRQGVTTIDGVEYDEVFVEPGTFTSGLKTNIFDFKTKWNILSGQSGITLAEGVGYIDGCPVYRVGQNPQNLRTATYNLSLGNNKCGDISVYVPTGYAARNITYSNGISGSTAKYSENQARAVYWYSPYNTLSQGSVYCSLDVNPPSVLCVDSPFEYGYTSGIVPADQSVIPENYGLSLQIPHDQLQTFYNTYPQYNVDNSVINIQQDQIDIDELTQAIFDQITSMEQIKAEWTAEPEPEPEPPGPAEDILEGVNTIIGQQNQQISQNQQQQTIQQQQLQEQQQIRQDTSSIKDTIESVTQTPTSEDLPDFKFDLRELFPFCIPFDIYRLLSSFDAEPEAPHVQLPIVIDSINFRYNLDLDFSAWNPVAQAMRTAELIVYAIGLAWATGKVIKW